MCALCLHSLCLYCLFLCSKKRTEVIRKPSLKNSPQERGHCRLLPLGRNHRKGFPGTLPKNVIIIAASPFNHYPLPL